MQISSLHTLDAHISRISPLLNGKQLFVVGGAVRDLILGIETHPTDIDMTLAGKPDVLQKKLGDNVPEGFSFFCTEKFGTMTLISKTDDAQITYELTPFREEGTYSDVRHPDELRRSDSLIADAKRRDFTMNCLYYTCVHLTPQGSAEKSLITLDDTNLIEQFFKGGEFQEDVFSAWAEKENIGYGGKLGFLIDPYNGLADLKE